MRVFGNFSFYYRRSWDGSKKNKNKIKNRRSWDNYYENKKQETDE